MQFSQQYLSESIEIIKQIDHTAIENCVGLLCSLRNNGGRLFVIGSGGSAAHASHAVCDFRKICNIEAYAPYDNIAELTARTNDSGYENSISDWLKVSKFNSNDALFIFSVGGGDAKKGVSVNIVKAVQLAKEIDAVVVGVVGKDGGYFAQNADCAIIIPPLNADRITPHTEGISAVIWHLIVSHPNIKLNPTRWESLT